MPFCALATIEELAGLEPSFDRDPIELDVPTALTAAEAGQVDMLAAELDSAPAPEGASQ